MIFSSHATPRFEQRVIVLGAGEIGFNLAQRLSKERRRVVIVDHNPERVAAAQSSLDAQTILGSASNPAVLRDAGAEDAGVVIAVTANDEVNLVACLIANIMNPNSLKLARVQTEDYSRMTELLGPEHMNIKAIINPDVEVVNAIIRMLRLPNAVDYAEFCNGRVKVAAMEIHAGPLVDRPLTDFPEIAKDRGVRVSGILRGEELILPAGGEVIRKGDVVYFVCLEESMDTVLDITDSPIRVVRNLCVIGGGDIGLRLARRLDAEGYRMKLVEKNARRCEFLANQLENVVVLAGDGTDRDFMRGENIGEMDLLVALTGDEETNILTCLLAKSIGVPATITRANKNGYMPIIRAIGLKLSVNPRLAATNSIVQFLRKGLLLSTLTTHDEEVEMLEAVLTEGSRLLDRPLRELGFPSGMNLLIIMRWDDIFIPRGDSVLQAGDRIILICERERLEWVDTHLIGRK